MRRQVDANDGTALGKRKSNPVQKLKYPTGKARGNSIPLEKLEVTGRNKVGRGVGGKAVGGKAREVIKGNKGKGKAPHATLQRGIRESEEVSSGEDDGDEERERTGADDDDDEEEEEEEEEEEDQEESKIELNGILEGDEQNEEEDEDDDASTSNLLHADDAIANGRAKLMRPDAASAALVRLLALYSL